MDVLVTYESRTGTTRRAAQLVGGGLRDAGATVSVAPVSAIDLDDLARADLVVVGTWTDGLFFFGQRPGGGGKIARVLPGSRVEAAEGQALGPLADRIDRLADGLGRARWGGCVRAGPGVGVGVGGWAQGLGRHGSGAVRSSPLARLQRPQRDNFASPLDRPECPTYGVASSPQTPDVVGFLQSGISGRENPVGTRGRRSGSMQRA